MAKALDDAKHQALHDMLTGLPNRSCFYDRTEQAMRQGARDGSAAPSCSSTWTGSRRSTTPWATSTATASSPRWAERSGGRSATPTPSPASVATSSACCCPGSTASSDALEVAERIIAALDEPLEIDGMVLGIEASCGIAMAPEDGDNADLLLQRADVAMYVAKGSNVNVVAYTDELNVNTPGRLTLLGDLRTAIADDQLVLHYQPKANLEHRTDPGRRGLVRWQHPHLGTPPARTEFIPVAEHTGLIKPLTTWVLDDALRQCRYGSTDDGPVWTTCRWPSTCPPAACSTTASRRGRSGPRPLGGPRPPARARDHRERHHDRPRQSPPTAHRVGRVGVRIAIDDFGTGYSSLAYLKDLPVNQLKIDQSFVSNMHEDLNDAIIVRSVVDLGHNLGLQIVAEGVEDHQTWDQLAQLGCDGAQGYFLARPMPRGRCESWMRAKALLPVGITF